MQIKVSNKSCFTLFEIMIVAAIICLLSLIAALPILKARTSSQANACINNLRQLDGGVQQYALENKLTSSSTYTLSVLKPYFKLTSASAIPGCPANGTYSPGATVTNAPTCSYSSATPA